MEKSELSPIQIEIALAIEQHSEKALITEAVLAKKVRQNLKMDFKNKAGIGLSDLEKALEYLSSSKAVHYSVHLNSANDILLRKDIQFAPLNAESRKRRLPSEKSMSILTNSDISAKKSSKPKQKKRTETTKINIYSNFEDID